MGRAGANWASRIAEIAGDELELDVARLPAEGIRRFEATPPDLILVIEQSLIYLLLHSLNRSPKLNPVTNSC